MNGPCSVSVAPRDLTQYLIHTLLDCNKTEHYDVTTETCIAPGG